MEHVEIIAKVLVCGDIHLSSRNYGGHKNYPKESLHWFKNITLTAQEIQATHIIGAGDISFGRFTTLEYRREVEAELEEQNKICNGQRYEVKGNHDSATYGMTEYEYYIDKGLLKPSINLSLGNLNITMVDDGKYRKTTPLIELDCGKTNVIIMHNYFKFKDTLMPDYGKALELDEFTPWFGVDYIIGGHIHNHEVFKGKIIKQGFSREAVVHYLGCPSRPAYRESNMQNDGHYAIITVYSNGTVEYQVHSFELWDIAESFDIEAMRKEDELIAKKRVDVTDIVKKLDGHERTLGNPEDVIMAMENIDIKYREKAIELIKLGQA